MAKKTFVQKRYLLWSLRDAINIINIEEKITQMSLARFYHLIVSTVLLRNMSHLHIQEIFLQVRVFKIYENACLMGETLKRLKNIAVIHLKLNVYKTHVTTVSSTMFTASFRMREIQVEKTVQPPLMRKKKKVVSTNVFWRINKIKKKTISKPKNKLEVLRKKNGMSLKELRNSISRIRRVVIILFNMGLYKSTFSTDSFGKLAFCLLALFALRWIEFDITFINFITFRNYHVYKYQVLCCFGSHLFL